VASVGLDDSLGPHLTCRDAHVRVDVAAVRWAPNILPDLLRSKDEEQVGGPFSC
jgi:hypothetical protein